MLRSSQTFWSPPSPGEQVAFFLILSHFLPLHLRCTISLRFHFIPAALHCEGLSWEAAQNALGGSAAAASSGNQLSIYSGQALRQWHSWLHADFAVDEVPKENNTLAKLSSYFIVQWLWIDNKFCSNITLVSEEFPPFSSFSIVKSH